METTRVLIPVIRYAAYYQAALIYQDGTMEWNGGMERWNGMEWNSGMTTPTECVL